MTPFMRDPFHARPQRRGEVQRAAELGAQGVTISVLAGNTPADGFDEAQRALAQAQATANRLGLRTEVEGF